MCWPTCCVADGAARSTQAFQCHLKGVYACCCIRCRCSALVLVPVAAKLGKGGLHAQLLPFNIILQASTCRHVST